MGMFLVCTIGFLLGFAVFLIVIYRWIEADTVEYDMNYVWDRYPVTKGQMEFSAEGGRQ
ncbi:hypothetical protein [Paenibacillus flagellatus]|uniref:hypothetical protein n=1 Tax=Paenibacillus flagellatus TaxID=2211139 RepID=UPI0013051B32|nr:hypothetical protein [Paenibacillus flagellatus]